MSSETLASRSSSPTCRRTTEIDSGEAVIVRMLFRLFDLGQRRTDIALVLNERGLTRRNGESWSQRQVAAVLNRRESYKGGVLRYGDVAETNRELRLIR